ncbi:MAG: hypothetical protein F4Z10_03060 [Synechococcus sp. SB0666_bin_14]|nr:hypothetical protein [Synechococcus sp. SB0666_bin_14]MYG46998.1 hypothetical protein [Synechococcus sp. SB0675_bin_6]MYJ60676.1 hypothetical protein [Synechococcus sp. SB0672_bin_6]MYK91292.1 hypothetical protein [Synechococcus sp. SB0669_bin_8]
MQPDSSLSRETVHASEARVNKRIDNLKGEMKAVDNRLEDDERQDGPAAGDCAGEPILRQAAFPVAKARL